MYRTILLTSLLTSTHIVMSQSVVNASPDDWTWEEASQEIMEFLNTDALKNCSGLDNTSKAQEIVSFLEEFSIRNEFDVQFQAYVDRSAFWQRVFNRKKKDEWNRNDDALKIRVVFERIGNTPQDGYRVKPEIVVTSPTVLKALGLTQGDLKAILEENRLRHTLRETYTKTLDAHEAILRTVIGTLSQLEGNLMPDLEIKPQISYDYIVTDADAWYRKHDAPYGVITPVPRNNVLEKGTQVAVLEVLKDNKGAYVAKIHLKELAEVEFTSLSNLSQVRNFDKIRRYRVIKDTEITDIPYSHVESPEYLKGGSEIEADKYCDEFIKVLNSNKDDTDQWVAKKDLVLSSQVSKESFVKETFNATKVGTKFTGDETTAACNICVRSALLLLKEDQALFPFEGSAYYDPANAFQVSYPKGYVSNPGKAQNIKEDFDIINSKIDLYTRFKEIRKQPEESWEVYFQRLQDKANNGEIVIGTMLSSDGSFGHVIMITPGGLINVKKSNEEYEGKWGSTFFKLGIDKVPRVLECGTGAREYEAPICRNVDRAGVELRLKWFIYKL